jgi:hypothetical protein
MRACIRLSLSSSLSSSNLLRTAYTPTFYHNNGFCAIVQHQHPNPPVEMGVIGKQEKNGAPITTAPLHVSAKIFLNHFN